MGESGKRRGEGDATLEFTPTWIVSAVCFVIIVISLALERYLHHIGQVLKRKNEKPLYNALQKVKEELMLLGFISLLLTVFQGGIQNICIPKQWTNYMLPCEREVIASEVPRAAERRLLDEGARHCKREGKVPLLSVEAIHQLHIFIFVLAITHVIFSALTVLIGGAKVRQWKHWEASIQTEVARDAPKSVTHGHQFQFIMDRVKRIDEDSVDTTWLAFSLPKVVGSVVLHPTTIEYPITRLGSNFIYHSFVKQFSGSVSKSDYITLRLFFISTHCKTNPKFDFHKYMVRAFEYDCNKVVGTSWYLWVYVIIFLLLNVDGWHTYLWIAFFPLILLLAVGTKLDHVITELAHDVADKYFSNGGDLVVNPSDAYFWFQKPNILLYLVHFILFQNAFDIAFLFWLFIPYGFDSCSSDHVGYAIPRLVIGIIIQILCSYSTLPLYAIVTQMGTHFKRSIFEEHVQENLVGWVQKAKRRSSVRANSEIGSTHGSDETPRTIEMRRLVQTTDSLMEEGQVHGQSSRNI